MLGSAAAKRRRRPGPAGPRAARRCSCGRRRPHLILTLIAVCEPPDPPAMAALPALTEAAATAVPASERSDSVPVASAAALLDLLAQRVPPQPRLGGDLVPLAPDLVLGGPF